jgi:hypothetical protein
MHKLLTPLFPKQKFDELITAKSLALSSVKPQPTVLPANPDTPPDPGINVSITAPSTAVAKPRQPIIATKTIFVFICFHL